MFVKREAHLESFKLAIGEFDAGVRRVDKEVPVARADAAIAFYDLGAGVAKRWGGSHGVPAEND
jgi:hypothetical protein